MRLLIVEDDAALADMLARSLREAGYAVDTAPDGEAAVVQAAVNDYDAIVLDVGLPRADGTSVARELRRRGNTAAILMLTARDAVRDRVAGLDAGADDYVTKPFSLDEVQARLRALLRRPARVLHDRLVIDDLEVDTAAQNATRARQPISLTTKEYVLLEYMARNAGRVIGRAELTEHVWDENHDPFSNALEVYINRLRGKVDGNHARKLIHTHRGAGYRLGDGPAADG
jgi:two-component system copper resistance phosphate regulon response regulator CusR